jgi:uncharacterized phiE125 gp8 family phage protein
MNGDFRRDPLAIDGGFLSIVSAPVNAIISTADAKAHCQVEDSDEDALIDGLVAAVTGYLDAQNGILGRALISQTWRLTLNHTPCSDKLRLAFPPVQSVSLVKYLDADGDEQTFASSNYRFVAGGDAPYIELASGASWPTVSEQGGSFWVEYVAGYGDDASDLPPSLVVAAKMLLGHFFEHREAAQEGAVSTVPMAFDALTQTFRVGRF